MKQKVFTLGNTITRINTLKSVLLVLLVGMVLFSCKKKSTNDESVKIDFPSTVMVQDIAQNPEGIEYDKTDHTFLLSSLNAGL